MTGRDLRHFLFGALVAALIFGGAWLGESRLRAREAAIYAHALTGQQASDGVDLLVAHAALRLAVPDRMTRALFGAQAFSDVSAEHRVLADQGAPEKQVTISTSPRGAAAAPTRPARVPQALKGSPGVRETP